MPVSIKDIAIEAGVSHTTVSHALWGSSLVSLETTKKIQETARKLGHLPSAAARSLRTNRSQALGVIVTNIYDPYFSEVLQGIEVVVQSNDYSLFMAASQHDPQREAMIVRAMQHRVDGVIICSTTFSDEQSQHFSKYGIPIVVINNQAVEDSRYSIYHDDIDGSSQLTRHLIQLGHRKFADLGNSNSGRTTHDRLAGFRQEMDATGLAVPSDHIHEIPGSEPDGSAIAVDYFLSLPNRPTGIVCFNDMVAIGMLKNLQERGIRVPEEISITGFDNIVFSNYANPPLTTFDQPKRFIGQKAVELILSLLDSTAKVHVPEQKIQVLKGKLLVRESATSPSQL